MPLCLALRGFPAIRVLGGIMIGGWIIRLLAARRQERAASTASHRHGKAPPEVPTAGLSGPLRADVGWLRVRSRFPAMRLR
jgi:hypothetical protein